MKTIYLRVKVPDGSPEINKAMVGSDDGYFHISNDVTEIQLPSEEEIRDSAEKKYPKRDVTKFLQQWYNTLRRLYVEAQMELINKLKGE